MAVEIANGRGNRNGRENREKMAFSCRQVQHLDCCFADYNLTAR